MDKQLQQLQRKRRSIRKKLDRLYVLAQKVMGEGESKKKDIADFRSGFEEVDRIQKNFEDFHLEIVAICSEDELEKEEEVQMQFDSVLYAIKSSYRDLNEIKNANNDELTANPSSPENRDMVKLPKIEVPRFDGNIKKWPMFFDLYRSLIHNNTSLKDVERFQFLVSYLEKDAATVVRNLPITGTNYSTAYDALVARYQNERVLITDYWYSIYRATPVKSDSAGELRSLLSVFSENLAALDQFKYDLWDFTKFNLLLQKLSPSLKTRFELEHGASSIPTYDELYKFLEKNCRALENSSLALRYPNSTSGAYRRDQGAANGVLNGKVKATLNLNTVLPKSLCKFCKKGSHFLSLCDAFLKSEIYERHKFVKRSRLCFNCLDKSHSLSACRSSSTCGVCGKRHHVLLHFPERSSGTLDQENEDTLLDGQSNEKGVQVMTSVMIGTSPVGVQSKHTPLFATAVVSVLDNWGVPIKCRLLLDSASQASFMTLSCANKLGLQRKPFSVPIIGINRMSTYTSLGTVSCVLTPFQKTCPSYQFDAYVIPHICETVACAPATICKWKYLEKLCLAEPDLQNSNDVDILLGVDLFGEVLLPGFVKGQNGGPCALNTVFGWVLMGHSQSSYSHNRITTMLTCGSELNETLKRFWEVECVPESSSLSPEDELCEQIFAAGHTRTNEGRYVVPLPFRDNAVMLGESRSIALRRFYLLEARLRRNPVLNSAYSEFMADYIDQGHMSVVNENLCDVPAQKYYIPHHGVMKTDGSKLRVVFDASCGTSTGLSLNDILLTGPKLQKDIAAILLSFRLFKFVFTADIRQMFRQILVKEDCRSFQMILWRSSPEEQVQEYILNTVTYGLSSSPYLAIRTLLQLCKDEGSEYPLAVNILTNFCYVDDAVGMADSVTAVLEAQRQLVSLLALGGFELRKWSSNCPQLLSSVPEAHQQPVCFENNDSSGIKVLGLQWSPMSDCFTYRVKSTERDCTKRNILSEIAKIYDPLGFLAPVVIVAKCLIQSLWIGGSDWDDTPSPEIVSQWQNFVTQLPSLTALSIPRWVVKPDAIRFELHGFCDASEKAYAAVIYLRQVCASEQVFVNLLCAKSRVAPLKRLSIPRLELCAAVLLCELVEFVTTSLPNLRVDNLFAWSDSTVVLNWVRSTPYRWKTFVANRVSKIQDQIPPSRWVYVNSKENPSDCASRGILPNQLCGHPLWWAGPKWLTQGSSLWPLNTCPTSQLEDVDCEERKLVCVSSLTYTDVIENLLLKFSSLNKVKRIVAYCIRFSTNCRTAICDRHYETLTPTELNRALIVLVKSVQRSEFSEDIRRLRKGDCCAKPLRKLAPFLDEHEVVRVGGRLRNSALAFDAKHPMLLPRSHRLTALIIDDLHRRHCHVGPQTLHFLLAQQFWVLSAKRAIHQILSKCIRCFRAKPVSVSPFMSDLPAVRISQVKPFGHSGVDFMGPIQIALGRRRGVSSQKAYIYLFVCMATRAIHLEPVSELSSAAFLAALRRFIGRRGTCTDIYSDQGTNFVGAKNLLNQYCKESASCLPINWHFNPPASPHFGGLWEAGVKSVKAHLRRVVGNQVLTFEEISTVLVQIESILNSRPLCSVSSDPNDLSCLTPGHFLTLEPLTAPPDENLSDVKLNRLSRWQLLQQMHQHFWKRWSVEYLHTLQQRHKWNHVTLSPSLGDLVLIRDENLPPLQWSLGRITKLYKSKDEIVRIAQVRTAKGLLDRPLVKLCALPTQ